MCSPMTNEIIPGRNAVAEALLAERKLLHIIVQRDSESARSQIIREARRRNIQVRFADRGALDSLVGKGNHQGIVAVAEARPPSTIDDLFHEAARRKEPPFLVVLDCVEDPQNLGAVMRSAEAAGVHGIILPERRSAGIGPAVHRASAGAVEYIKVARVTSISQTIRGLKVRNVWVIGAEMSAPTSYFDEDLGGPICLVIGGEDTGVSPSVAQMCDRLVKIPMRGRIRSLSVSATAAIILFERMRQQTAIAGKRPPDPQRKPVSKA